MHHGNIATQDMITETCAEYVTTSFKNRWRSLMSVDDVIEATVKLVEAEGLADNTYFLYSSDHGFQLGEFNILIDKRQVKRLCDPCFAWPCDPHRSAAIARCTTTTSGSICLREDPASRLARPSRTRARR